MSDRDTSRLLREWPWGLALLVGSALRVYGLSAQVPVDDEWHAIHRVLDQSYTDIALSFGFVDHCIPLTLLFKLASDTIGLSDAVLRLPSLLAGIALLVVAPALASDLVGRRGRALYAWLLALAPLLVLYARYVRPYGIALLLCLLSLHASVRWWRTGRPRHALAYGGYAALAGYVLLPTLPFVLGPLAVAALAMPFAAGTDARARTRRFALPALAFGLFALPLLGPPLLQHPAVVFGKLGVTSLPDAHALRSGAAFLLGTQSPFFGALLVALGLAGARVLWRGDRAFALLALGATTTLAIGILASGLAYAWLGFVLARYLLPVLPLAMLAIAASLEDAARRLGVPRLVPAAGVAIGAMILATGGTLTALRESRAWFPGRFIAGIEGLSPEPAHMPAFYAALAQRPAGSLTLVESPWFYSLWNNLLPAYEQIHGQRTRIGMTTGLCSARHWGEYPGDRGVALGSFVPLADPEAVRRASVDYIVFHRDLAAEMATVIDPIDVRATGQPDILECAAAYARLGWPIIFQDEAIVVFEVPPTDAVSPPASP